MAGSALLSIEEYERLGDNGVRSEFVDGWVIELASGSLQHGVVRDRSAREVETAAGGVACVEAEFRTSASRVRRADDVWFAPGRLVESDWSRSILPVPDLAVEVVSPGDRAAEVRLKVHEYLDAGVTTVWLIYLESREADIWNRGRRTALAGTDTLTADCLPGFSLPLDRVFPTVPAARP